MPPTREPPAARGGPDVALPAPTPPLPLRRPPRSRIAVWLVVLAAATWTACGGGNRLAEYDFAGGALALVDLGEMMADRILERGSRYLGTRPVESEAEADYLLELGVRDYGIDARRSG